LISDATSVLSLQQEIQCSEESARIIGSGKRNIHRVPKRVVCARRW